MFRGCRRSIPTKPYGARRPEVLLSYYRDLLRTWPSTRECVHSTDVALWHASANMYYVSVCVMCRHLTSPQTPSSQRWATHSRIKDSREETRGAMDPSRVTYRFGFIFPGEQHAWWCLVFSVARQLHISWRLSETVLHHMDDLGILLKDD